MDVYSVSSSGVYYNARSNMLSSQKQLYEASQKTDGFKGHTYSAFYDQAHALLGFESQLSALEGYVHENGMVDSRLQRVENVLTSIKNTFTQFRSSFLYARNHQDYTTVGLRQRANEALNQIIADLNSVDEEGVYLFSGSRFNMAPVNMGLMSPPVPGGGANTLYYQGDHLLPQQQIDLGQTLTYGVTADHPAFEQLLRAYNLAAHTPDQDPQRQAYLDESFTALNNGFEALVDVISQVGDTRRQITEATQRVQNLKDMTQDQITEIVQADPAEVISRFTALQTQLQATLMVIQRLQQISLVNIM